jgi:hypothetical protein
MLLRIRNTAPFDRVALIAITIAQHRRTPLNNTETAELLANMEALVNALQPLEQVPEPSMQNHEITALQERLAEAEQSVTIGENVIQDLQTQLTVARAVQERLLEARPIAVTPAPATFKIPDPDKFDGDKGKLREFTMQLQLKTQTITDEQNRLRYAISRLSGRALSQLAPFIQADNINLTNIEALLRILETAFGDPDRVATAEQKIETL